jgi:hypothetical protein
LRLARRLLEEVAKEVHPMSRIRSVAKLMAVGLAVAMTGAGAVAQEARVAPREKMLTSQSLPHRANSRRAMRKDTRKARKSINGKASKYSSEPDAADSSDPNLDLHLG